MSDTIHLESLSAVSGNISVHIDTTNLNKKLNRAQWVLDNQIMTDMVPLMPMVTGTFINTTRIRSASLAGTGQVVAASAPTGRFLYFGKVMVDPLTGSPWARKGAKKVVTDQPLRYSRAGAVSEWFESAKAQHLSEWITIVRRELT